MESPYQMSAWRWSDNLLNPCCPGREMAMALRHHDLRVETDCPAVADQRTLLNMDMV
jgi:hypothetical protein